MPVAFTQKSNYDIHDLLQIMELLRGEGGCPWDAEQDHHSIRKNLIEEVYEAVEAIDTENTALLREELGDVLMQVVFHTQIEQEIGGFDFGQVCDEVCKKLIVRHPHVFAQVHVENSAQVLDNWEKIKSKTKGQTTAAEKLESVPAVLPALMRSEKVQGRAAKAGFDYTDCDWAMRDLESELLELKEAIAGGVQAEIDEELGDLLFSVVNVSRFVKTEAELALTRSCEKFIRRFRAVEELAAERGIEMKTTPVEELDKLWKEIKKR